MNEKTVNYLFNYKISYSNGLNQIDNKTHQSNCRDIRLTLLCSLGCCVSIQISFLICHSTITYDLHCSLLNMCSFKCCRPCPCCSVLTFLTALSPFVLSVLISTHCDNHSEAELINSTKHWMDHGINNVKAGPVAAGRAARPADHTAIQRKPREVFFSTEG